MADRSFQKLDNGLSRKDGLSRRGRSGQVSLYIYICGVILFFDRLVCLQGLLHCADVNFDVKQVDYQCVSFLQPTTCPEMMGNSTSSVM